MSDYKSWINENKEFLLQYRGCWIAYTYKKGLIAYGEKLTNVIAKAEKVTKKYIIWHVNKHFGEPRALLVRMARKNVYTIRDESHYWIPEYPVTLLSGKKRIVQNMLVDSGSDFTIIPFETGKQLGFAATEEELRHKGYGVTGSFLFLEREVTCIIDKHKFKLPVAWLQEMNTTDYILGREIVFDLFDIEFRQADESVAFKWRK